MSQLALTGTATPPALRLTRRQRLALEMISERQPLPSERLGAYLHELRRLEGGKGHAAEERCVFCSSEGAAMGAALRRKGLVKFRLRTGWVLAASPRAPGVERTVDGRGREQYDPATAPIPY